MEFKGDITGAGEHERQVVAEGTVSKQSAKKERFEEHLGIAVSHG